MKRKKKETKMVKTISKVSTTEKNNDLDDLILQQDGLFCSVKTFYSI